MYTNLCQAPLRRFEVAPGGHTESDSLPMLLQQPEQRFHLIVLSTNEGVVDIRDQKLIQTGQTSSDDIFRNGRVHLSGIETRLGVFDLFHVCGCVALPGVVFADIDNPRFGELSPHIAIGDNLLGRGGDLITLGSIHQNPALTVLDDVYRPTVLRCNDRKTAGG